jgi:hypothetical protein
VGALSHRTFPKFPQSAIPRSTPHRTPGERRGVIRQVPGDQSATSTVLRDAGQASSEALSQSLKDFAHELIVATPHPGHPESAGATPKVTANTGTFIRIDEHRLQG